jgi:hypothetical protein
VALLFGLGIDIKPFNIKTSLTFFRSSYLRNSMLGSCLRLQNPKMWFQMGPSGTEKPKITQLSVNSGTVGWVCMRKGGKKYK